MEKANHVKRKSSLSSNNELVKLRKIPTTGAIRSGESGNSRDCDCDSPVNPHSNGGVLLSDSDDANNNGKDIYATTCVPGGIAGFLKLTPKSPEMPTLKVKPVKVVSLAAEMTVATDGGPKQVKTATKRISGAVNSTKVGPGIPISRYAPMGLMDNLPYMGELTFDTRPRRGRKPKKADICHLISKNYGIQFPNSYVNQPNTSLANTVNISNLKGASTTKDSVKLRKHGNSRMIDPVAGNFPWNFFPELIPSSTVNSSAGAFAPPSTISSQKISYTSPQISFQPTTNLIFPPSITLTPIRSLTDEPLNLCVRDSSTDETQLQMTKDNVNSISTLNFLSSNIYYGKNDKTGSSVNHNRRTGANPSGPSKNHNTQSASTSSKPVRDSTLVNLGPPGNIKSNVESQKAERQSTTISSRRKRTAGKAGANWSSPQLQTSRPPTSAAKVREQTSSAAAAAAVAAANSAEVSICKFKFTGGAKPSLQEKKMLSVDSGGNFRFFTDKPSSCGAGNRGGGLHSGNQHGRNSREDQLSLQFSSDSTTLPKSAKSMSMCMMPSIMAATASPPSLVVPEITSEDTTAEPMEFKEENLSPSPLYGHSNSSNSSDSNNSNDNEHHLPLTPNTRHLNHHGSSSSLQNLNLSGVKMKVKRKRRTRKSLMREKLEKTFKEKGFLIQTQQLESAEGATYCKFRQLRKFTRYLFRSWKDYLPDTVKEIGGAAGASGPNINNVYVSALSSGGLCPPGGSPSATLSNGPNDQESMTENANQHILDHDMEVSVKSERCLTPGDIR